MTGFTAQMSTYNQGFSQGLTIRGLPIALAHPGKVFFVGDATNVKAYPNRKTGSDGNRGSFLDPYATIDYAVGQCLAGRGDIIYVLPGHVEDIAAAYNGGPGHPVVQYMLRVQQVAQREQDYFDACEDFYYENGNLL